MLFTQQVSHLEWLLFFLLFLILEIFIIFD